MFRAMIQQAMRCDVQIALRVALFSRELALRVAHFCRELALWVAQTSHELVRGAG